MMFKRIIIGSKVRNVREGIDIVERRCGSRVMRLWTKTCSMDLRSEALKPSGGEPTGQVSNSHGISKGVAGASEEPVPDLFCAGAERTV